MKFVTYMVSGRMLTGVLNPEETWVYPISAAGMEYGSMAEMIRHAGASELEMAEYISRREPYEVPGAVPIGEVKLLAPIPHPAQDAAGYFEIASGQDPGCRGLSGPANGSRAGGRGADSLLCSG